MYKKLYAGCRTIKTWPMTFKAPPPLSPSTFLPRSLGRERSSRVLLADDNADMREYVQGLLRQQYEVEAVADGEAALKQCAGAAPRPDSFGHHDAAIEWLRTIADIAGG